ncbi:hypothetical protein LL037_18785 [Clostridium estertheticum]|uniref:hypothetical protein n=1 Tax=Clostridium estertheticum TaxID=238834 RepID=UPI001C0D849C|nr:hypothetical protein [Clostridium estertheticum]MBU3198516.1 hypothetical protein [Clostridium estertheticum]WAG64497.1 hypothetical protein LL037_18785 [Clostridium estertheticum]
MKKIEVTLTDWAIVLYPSIYKATENPINVFAKLNCGSPVALFGKSIGNPRYNEETDAFADGHRLITSPIIAVKNGKYHTVNTIYSLDEEEKNTEFKRWCKINQYKETPLSGVWDKTEDQGKIILRHVCEHCGKQQLLTSKEGYKQGWDYPPKMGAYKIISPRTCGDCGINTTLWWEITCNKTSPNQLSERHQQTLKRILTEAESIMP